MYEFHTENEDILSSKRRIKWKAIFLVVIMIGLILAGFYYLSPPKDFPTNKIITIEAGLSLDAIAKKFEEEKIVRSAGVFKTFVLMIADDKNISIGDYLFETPLDVRAVAQRVASGKFGVDRVVVTFPEGFTNKEMAVLLGNKMMNFNQEEFLFLTKNLEGYLFPDTYYFFGSDKPNSVVKILRDNFNKKIRQGLANDIESSNRSFEDIIKMASIIEAEAYDGYVEKQTISGILWKRLDKGIKLQVDATSGYEFGKESSGITSVDLKKDSPYNTYLYAGLPPTPIGNPGLESIKAAIYPIETEYFFYLHDKSAKIYYAKTYDEHKKNINKYLK